LPEVFAEPVTFTVDPAAEPGSALPALARLLVGIDKRRRHTDDEQAGDQGQEGNGQSAQQKTPTAIQSRSG
jgi:hypothetical protein